MQKTLRFLMKNRSFSSLINNFQIGIKNIYQRGKTPIFHQKYKGVLHSLFACTSIRICSYYHQNLFIQRFRGKFQYVFQTKFFPLDFEGISNNSVYCMETRRKKQTQRKKNLFTMTSVCFGIVVRNNSLIDSKQHSLEPTQ